LVFLQIVLVVVFGSCYKYVQCFRHYIALT
jgi:hypothetical protein